MTMLKRKEFILGAAVGLTFAAAATAGGVISWPTANAQVAGVSGRIAPSAGASGLAFAPPQGAPLSFADIFDQVSPAVVQIEVESPARMPQGVFQIPGLPFGFRAPEPEEGEEPPTQQGAGSGFFISDDGFIVTNNHVVADATEITVTLSDERELKATLVGRDARTDLAVLKVEGDNFPFVSFEDRAEPRVGDWVIAVGNPFGLGGTATAGIVSAKARDIDPNSYNDFIQIDAAINRGNSGGPTFDIYGRVIGVNSAIFSPTGGSVGIGFAIPAVVAKTVTDQLMRGETIQRGFVGITMATQFPEANREAMGFDDEGGVYISGVTDDGPADRAGLQIGDIVVALNGEPVEDSSDLSRRVAAAAVNDTVRFRVWREGRERDLSVRAIARPASADEITPSDEPAEGTAAPIGEVVEGLRVAPLSDGLRRRYGITADVQGLVITGITTSTQTRAMAEFRPGRVIVYADNQPMASVSDFRTAAARVRQSGRRGILLLLREEAGNLPVVLPFSAPE